MDKLGGCTTIASTNMRFAIDISLINQDNAGINQYTREILRELVQHGEHEFLLFARKLEALPFELPTNTKLKVLQPKSKWLGGWYRALASKLRQEKVDALLTFALTPVPLFFGRTVAYIHDISPITQRQYNSWWQTTKFRLLLGINVRRAQKILTISQTSADQLKQLFFGIESPIEIVYPGLAKRFTGEISATAIAEFKNIYGLKENFFLSVGTLQPRKNYLTVVKAFHKFIQQNGHSGNWQYVIAGGFGWDYHEVIDYIHAYKLEEKVKILSRLNDMEIVVALRAANGFIQLSLDEGFGMPLIEAAANGLPILASNIQVFREIDLINTIYAEPTDIIAAAAKLNELSSMNKTGVNSDIAERFSWKASAQKLLQALVND